MTAYVINLPDEENSEKKQNETKGRCPRKTVFFMLFFLLIFLATFRLWLMSHVMATPTPLMDYTRNQTSWSKHGGKTN